MIKKQAAVSVLTFDEANEMPAFIKFLKTR